MGRQMPRREAALWPRPGSLYFSSPRFLSASTWICPPDLPFSAGVLSPCGFRRPPCGRAVRVRLLHLPVVSRRLAPRTSRPRPRRVLSRATPPLVIAAAQPFPLPVLASACAPLSIALADRPCQRSLLHSHRAANAVSHRPPLLRPFRGKCIVNLSFLLAITGIIASKNARSFSTEREAARC